MESVVNEYISRELASDLAALPLRNDTPLLESGILDSLALLKLLVFLEKEFAITVDGFDFNLENFNTVDAICAYVRSHNRQELVSQ